ncbi:hypothetical protein [Actinopolymorpha cephalotaxi]|uniref:Uncharacterized protein n=1 Tax=Actinopolymorpha cephalotaxi TaxID=504797 RepID=A0ABX2S0T3_9ACTN|nr:hypothetical protein [Actinopolymorpha cephalotaxi]NYH82901.1 hypothetical protein [Actinopolymorpha cephalotaxi]
MMWVLIFGGIAVFAVVLYALLGVWLWRRAKGVLTELGAAERKLQIAAERSGDEDSENHRDSGAGGNTGAAPARHRPTPGRGHREAVRGAGRHREGLTERRGPTSSRRRAAAGAGHGG